MIVMDKTLPATKADIDDVTNLIREVIEIMSESLAHQNEKTDSLQQSVNSLQASTEASLSRIENKLDPTIELVDGHETRLKLLEQAAS
jgi:hypothetical protein